MTNKALIVVDYSYDFIADDGRLTCGKPGQDIEQFIVERLNQYQHQHEVKSFFDKYKNEDTVHYLDKRRYDSFYGTALDSLLRERHIDTVEIVGVCTDICVLHTAISAYNLGYHIIIPEQGVASFNEEGHQFALAHFKNSLGAKVEVIN